MQAPALKLGKAKSDRVKSLKSATSVIRITQPLCLNFLDLHFT